MTETQLQDKETRDFIYDFIDRHGGIEAAMLEVNKQQQQQQEQQMAAAPPPPPRQTSLAQPPQRLRRR